MSTIWISLGAAILIFVFGIIGLVLQQLLPEQHTTDRSQAMIGAIVGLFSLLLALVLGTLIGNAYAFYSVQKSELETFASRVVQLDLSLSEYGPETMPVRLKIKDALLKTHGARCRHPSRDDRCDKHRPNSDQPCQPPLAREKLPHNSRHSGSTQPKRPDTVGCGQTESKQSSPPTTPDSSDPAQTNRRHRENPLLASISVTWQHLPQRDRTEFPAPTPR